MKWVRTAGGEGTLLLGFARGGRRLDFFRISLENGKRELWRSHSPQTAQSFIQRALITPDGRNSLIAVSHAWHELYVVEAIR